MKLQDNGKILIEIERLISRKKGPIRITDIDFPKDKY